MTVWCKLSCPVYFFISYAFHCSVGQHQTMFPRRFSVYPSWIKFRRSSIHFRHFRLIKMVLEATAGRALETRQCIYLLTGRAPFASTTVQSVLVKGPGKGNGWPFGTNFISNGVRITYNISLYIGAIFFFFFFQRTLTISEVIHALFLLATRCSTSIILYTAVYIIRRKSRSASSKLHTGAVDIIYDHIADLFPTIISPFLYR